MPETKCSVCEKNLILDEENVCAQCELIKETTKKIEIYNNNVDCGTCKDIVDKNTEGLYCDVCDRWYHNAYGCCEIPLTEYLYCQLKEEASNNVKWYCDKCIWDREKWINSLKDRNNDNEESDDLSDIEIENNLNVRKRGRPRRLDDNSNSDHKYDQTNEPEITIDERSQSTDSEGYEPRKVVKKVKRRGPKKKSKRNNKRLSCDLCSKRFLKSEDLIAHKLLHVGDKKPFKCTDCESSFTLKSGLKQHSIKHDQGKPFFCDICARGFKWKSAYMRHLKEIHSDNKNLQCSLCEFTATNQSRLDAHMRKHSDDRPFKCTECDYGGKTLHTLKAHMITHSSLKPYVCLECGKAFNKTDRLKNHMYEHTGAWPFACAICDAKFASESALVTHARKHTGERPYACSICDFRARTKNALNQHERTHSGERAFPCDICGKRLCHSNALKMHKMIHTGEKPHKCELCGKKVRLKSTLKKHMEYHMKTNFQIVDKPYECEMCGNRYKEMKSLNKHIRGDRNRKPCQGENGTGNISRDLTMRKNANNEQKPDLASFTDQEPGTNRFIIKPLSEKARKKSNLKPSPEQVHMRPKENLNQQNNQEPSSSMHNLTAPPQNFQNPPPLLNFGVTNNYTQYHEMFMNASSSTQWAQNKFWN